MSDRADPQEDEREEGRGSSIRNDAAHQLVSLQLNGSGSEASADQASASANTLATDASNPPLPPPAAFPMLQQALFQPQPVGADMIQALVAAQLQQQPQAAARPDVSVPVRWSVCVCDCTIGSTKKFENVFEISLKFSLVHRPLSLATDGCALGLLDATTAATGPDARLVGSSDSSRGLITHQQ